MEETVESGDEDRASETSSISDIAEFVQKDEQPAAPPAAQPPLPEGSATDEVLHGGTMASDTWIQGPVPSAGDGASAVPSAQLPPESASPVLRWPQLMH